MQRGIKKKINKWNENDYNELLKNFDENILYHYKM